MDKTDSVYMNLLQEASSLLFEYAGAFGIIVKEVIPHQIPNTWATISFATQASKS